jgi:cytosine/uracil/thiamine/allantoin permease
MAFKIFAALVAAVLMLAFLAPVVVKLKDGPLAAVVTIGVVLMLFDLWQSLQSKED